MHAGRACGHASGCRILWSLIDTDPMHSGTLWRRSELTQVAPSTTTYTACTHSFVVIITSIMYVLVGCGALVPRVVCCSEETLCSCYSRCFTCVTRRKPERPGNAPNDNGRCCTSVINMHVFSQTCIMHATVLGTGTSMPLFVCHG